MKFKKSFLFLLLLILLPMQVLAKNTIKLEASNDDLKSGDEVTITATLESDTNLYALLSTFSYDENVFEKIDDHNFSVQDNWSDITYNSKNKKFGLINKSSEITPNILNITLKVKENASVGKTTITLANINASDGEKKVSFPNTSVSVYVTKDAKENETLPNNKQETTINDEDQSIIVKNNRLFLIGLIITIASLFVIMLFLNAIKIKNKKAINITFGILILASVLILGGLYFVLQDKKDVNNDGKQDYNDATEIIKYIINMEGTKEENNNAEINNEENNVDANRQTNNQISPNNTQNIPGDVNNDGKVDVVDVSSSVQNTTNKNYKVKLSLIKLSTLYYEPNKELTINFNADINPDAKIKKVEIDGVFYDVIKNEAFYSVNITTPKTSGIHEFNFTNVILDNKKTVKTNMKVKIEVLKKAPTVQNFQINDQTNELNFNLIDEDDALINANLSITNQNNEQVFNKTITKGEFKETYNFNKDEQYQITLTASYDLDTNKLNNETGDKNAYQNEILLDKQVKILTVYNFNIENVSLTSIINKNENPVLTFKSHNDSNYPIESIIINNEEYKVTMIDNLYYVTLPSTNAFGQYSIDINKIILANGKAFQNNQDFEVPSLKYTVLKTNPSIDNLKLTKDEDNKTITATFDLNDPDQALSNLKAILIDEEENVVVEEQITNQKSVTLSYQNSENLKFIVRLIGDYSLGIDHEYQNITFTEKTIYITTRIYFTKATVSNYYPNKGEEIYAYFELHMPKDFKPHNSYPTNISNLITGITINGLNYPATKNKEENETATYTVGFKVGNISEVETIEANRVIFYDNEAFYLEPIPINIEVLKSKPHVENFNLVNEDYENKLATFSFDVLDDNGGFDDGIIAINEQELPIKKGSNTVTFSNISTDEVLNITIYGNYDLDTNVLDNEHNYYEKSEIFTTTYGLYNPKNYQDVILTNVKTNHYYAKNEPINISFNIQGLDNDFAFDIEKIIIKDQAYLVTKQNDHYETTLNGFANAGLQTLEINQIILTNGKKISLKTPAIFQFEILKDKLALTDFKYQVSGQKITMNMNLEDKDNTLINNIIVKIVDENNNNKYEFIYDQKNITFQVKDNITRYYVHAYASYDLDLDKTSKDNNYQNELILDEVISLENNYFELKDITNIELYKNDELITKANLDDLKQNYQNYYLKIQMSDKPDFYSNIKGTTIENNHLYLILENEYASINKIDFGEIKNNEVTNEASPYSFESFIEKIIANPNGNYTLTHDLDADSYESLYQTLTDIDFTGVLDGNGYTIKNLNKPLFKSITNGTVKNLTLENVKLPNNDAHGSLANTASKANISNIIITSLTKSGSQNNFGPLVGSALNDTKISSCAVKGIKINNTSINQEIGGLVGRLENSSITNSYAIGTIDGGWHFMGGLVGNAQKSVISYSYSKVTINDWYYDSLNSGIACGSPSLINTVSLSSGNNGYKISNNNQSAKNNFALKESNYLDNQDAITIEKNNLNSTFFTNDAKFDNSIWDLQNASYENPPTLKIEFKSSLSQDSIKDNNLYDPNKELLYKNLALLTPFFDSNNIISNGSKISTDDILNKQEIMHIIPKDEKGSLVSYLTTNNYKKIKELKVIFKNQETKTYQVRFDKLYQNVAAYRLTDLKIDYTYNHYLINEESNIVKELTNYLTKLDYQKDLDLLTTTKDSRIYKDYYNEVTKNELKEFILKYLSVANQDLSLEKNSSSLIKDLKNNDKLKKALYVYNYFNRFYHFSIDNIMFNDFIYFQSTSFNKNLTPDEITNIFLSDEANFKTNSTNTAYNNTLAKFTNINNITNLIEYFVNTLTNDSPSTWFAKTFKGYLVEVKVNDLQYTMWDHLSYEDNTNWPKWQNYALVLLTMPENAAYIISSPTQYLIGSQRTYIKDPFNKDDIEYLHAKIDEYADKIRNYFQTSAGFINDAKYFDAIHGIQLDNRYTLDSNGKQSYQSKLVTEEPFHKNFNEVVDLWKEMDGYAATSNGTHILWNAYTALSAYDTWSHEMAHNIDARLFLKNNSRRYDAGGEDYSDGNLAQRWGEGDINMNLTYNFDINDNKATNLTVDRINNKTKIWDFYRKVFETIYILDYIEAKAFLKLSPEDQARLAVQTTYPDEVIPESSTYEPTYKRRLRTRYITKSAQEIEQMKLEDMEDLYNNRLAIYPGVILSTITDNRYGTENIFRTRWYQPHNDNGRPDSYSLKFFAYEMLGLKGYDDGYIEYYSNIHAEANGYKTDLMALQKITGEKSFKDYKLNRFKEVEKNLTYIQHINVNEVFNDFYKALQKDALTVKEVEDKNIANEEQRNKELANARAFKESVSVRKNIYYYLKRTTNDFTKEIYDYNTPHPIEKFEVE